MRPELDTLVVHNDRVEKVIGYFCGSPIYALSTQEADFDAARYRRNIVLMNKELSDTQSEVSTAEVLPGELVCPDGIVRRGTTAEAIGDEYYNQAVSEENTQRISIVEAQVHSDAGAVVTWRPDRKCGQGEFALLHEEAV
jgi:hypothetical protein